LREIISRYQHNIKRIIRNFTGSDNEDIEQEIYIKTWKSMKNYEEKNKFKQWISAIASNTCKDYLKKKRVILVNDDEEINKIKEKDNLEEKLDSKERQKRILKEVNKLPSKMKNVLVYYEFEEKSYEDISLILNIPEGTVKSRLYKAREILREKLKDLM